MHSIPTSVGQWHHGSRATAKKHNTATPGHYSTSAKRHKAIARRTTKSRQAAILDLEPQCYGAEDCSATRVRAWHTTNTTAKNEASPAECIKEIVFITRQIVTEGCRAFVAMFAALMSTAHFLVQVCRLACAVACLALAVGRRFYDTGKSLWEKWVV